MRKFLIWLKFGCLLLMQLLWMGFFITMLMNQTNAQTSSPGQPAQIDSFLNTIGDDSKIAAMGDASQPQLSQSRPETLGYRAIMDPFQTANRVIATYAQECVSYSGIIEADTALNMRDLLAVQQSLTSGTGVTVTLTAAELALQAKADGLKVLALDSCPSRHLKRDVEAAGFHYLDDVRPLFHDVIDTVHLLLREDTPNSRTIDDWYRYIERPTAGAACPEIFAHADRKDLPSLRVHGALRSHSNTISPRRRPDIWNLHLSRARWLHF
jgi:hypothetical protein